MPMSYLTPNPLLNQLALELTCSSNVANLPPFSLFLCIFLYFWHFLLFFPLLAEKDFAMLKEKILMSKRQANHQFAGQNTQQIMLHLVLLF